MVKHRPKFGNASATCPFSSAVYVISFFFLPSSSSHILRSDNFTPSSWLDISSWFAASSYPVYIRASPSLASISSWWRYLLHSLHSPLRSAVLQDLFSIRTDLIQDVGQSISEQSHEHASHIKWWLKPSSSTDAHVARAWDASES